MISPRFHTVTTRGANCIRPQFFTVKAGSDHDSPKSFQGSQGCQNIQFRRISRNSLHREEISPAFSLRGDRGIEEVEKSRPPPLPLSLDLYAAMRVAPHRGIYGGI